MKQWSLALCLALALVLTACAGGDSSQNSSAQSPSDAGDTSQSDSGAQEAAGLLSSFSTTDLEGNAVDQSILEDYDLTMVNVWATYCTPCLQEMPDLGELASEYADKGVQILGLVSDVLNSDGTISDSQVETAQEIVEETGASYQHLLPSADLLGLLSQIYGVPTTFFVDSAGNQVGYAYVTAMEKEDWVQVIDGVMEEAGL